MSSQIRRSIGIARKHLLRALQLCDEDLHTDLTDHLPTASNDDLLDYAELQTTHRESILEKLSKMEDLNAKWIELMTENTTEVTIFHDYITKYGDYRGEIQNAIDVLQRLDNHAALLQEEFKKRGVTYQPSVSSTRDTRTMDILGSKGTTQRVNFVSSEHQQQHSFTTSHTDVQLQPSVNENPNLNYFDASLLSRLELPSFAGNILEFPEFWARYHALIHCKTTISDATKFSLLKSCFKGRALHNIDGLPVTNENYAAAIDILLSIYDNPSTLRHLIYTQLLSLPPCDSDGRQLQELYLKMLRLVCQYTAITPDSPEFGLGALLYNKLPRFVKARIYDITGGQKNLTPSELMTMLADIVRKESTLRQIDASTTPQQLTYHVSAKPGRQLRPPPNRQLERQNPRTSFSQRNTKPCPFCKRTSHSAIYCRIAQTPEERRKFAKTSKMCLKCLEQGHQTITCARPPCPKCQYHHHPALCFKSATREPSSNNRNVPPHPHPSHPPHLYPPHPRFRSRTPNSSTAHTKTTTQRPSPTTPPPHPSQNIHFSNEVNNDQTDIQPEGHSLSYSATQPTDAVSSDIPSSETSVLLMCTTVPLMNPNDNSIKLDTVAFLDSGSSHTYITTEVAEKLELHRTPAGNITLHTFGTSSPTTLKSHLHTLQIRLKDQTPYTVSAQSLPILTQALKIPTSPLDHISS